MFQHMPGSLPAQSQQMYSTHQSQYRIPPHVFPSKPELNIWTKIYKRGKSAQEETEEKSKHGTESEHWINQTSTSSRYTALLQEEVEDEQHKKALKTRQILLQYI
jgi:hypothetical protein